MAIFQTPYYGQEWPRGTENKTARTTLYYRSPMQFVVRKMLDIYLENDKILCSGRNFHLQWLLQGKLN